MSKRSNEGRRMLTKRNSLDTVTELLQTGYDNCISESKKGLHKLSTTMLKNTFINWSIFIAMSQLFLNSIFVLNTIFKDVFISNIIVFIFGTR